jgi:hypothetical protein
MALLDVLLDVLRLRAAGALQVLTSILLGLSGIIDTLALYWLLFALFIQRGPIVPQVYHSPYAARINQCAMAAWKSIRGMLRSEATWLGCVCCLQEEELSEPAGLPVQLGVVFLGLSLLILLPYPGTGGQDALGM